MASPVSHNQVGYIPLNPIKPPFSYGFPMVFLWFSYGFPMVFLWFPRSPRLVTFASSCLSSCRWNRALSCATGESLQAGGDGRKTPGGKSYGDVNLQKKYGGLPSGNLLHSYGKSPFLMGKSTISMAIFNSELLVYRRAVVKIGILRLRSPPMT